MKTNLAKVLTAAETAGATRRGWMMLAGGVGAAALAAGCSKAAAAPEATPAAAPAPTGPAILSSNESPWGPSPMAQEAMKAEVGKVNRYADKIMRDFAAQVAEKEGVTADHVIVSNGSAPILTAFAEMVAMKGKGQLVTSECTYEQVPRGVAAFGAEVIETKLTADMNFDLDAMASKISSKTTASYICNPNNPTGKVVDAAALKAFSIEAAKTAPVFLDEAYLDLADGYEPQVQTGLVRDGHNVIICRTFSKLYAMAGQRLGYAIMQPELAKKMQMAVRLGGVNHLGIVAGMASLKDDAYFNETRTKVKAARETLIAMAKAHGRQVAESPQGNFIYMETGMPNTVFAEKMLAENVRVVGRTWKGYENWTRICVGQEWEIEACKKAMQKVFPV